MNNKEQEFKEYFLSLIEPCSVNIVNPYRHLKFFYEENKILMHYSVSIHHCWLSNNYILLPLKIKFGFYFKIGEMMNNIEKILIEYYNLKHIWITTKTIE